MQLAGLIFILHFQASSHSTGSGYRRLGLVLMPHGGALHASGSIMAQVCINSILCQIDQWRQDDGHAEFIHIIHETDGQYFLPAPSIADLEGNEQYNEAVHELRHHRRTRRAQPYILIACLPLDLVKDKYIYHLADQESGQASEKASCMFGTPWSVFDTTHHSGGVVPMAK